MWTRVDVLFMHASVCACVHMCVFLCECAFCRLILMAVECDCRRWSFVYCLVMDGFPLSDRPPFRRASLWVSLCCTGPGRKGGRAPFLSVSHWYSSLKSSVGHFCFIRNWNGGGRDKGPRGATAYFLFCFFFYFVVKSMQLFACEKKTTLNQKLQHLDLH